MNKDLYSMKKNGCEDIRARSYNRHKKYVKKKKKATRSGRGKDGRRCWLYGLRQMQHTHPRVQIVAIYGQGISPPQSALSPIHLHAESRSAVAFVHQWSWRSLMARNGTSSYLTRLCFPSFSAAPFFFSTTFSPFFLIGVYPLFAIFTTALPPCCRRDSTVWISNMYL